MGSKRDEFLAKMKKNKEIRLVRERYKQCVGKQVSPEKLSESQFRMDEKDLSKYTLWFKPTDQPHPGDGCAVMRADLCIEVIVKANTIKKIRVFVHTMDKMGTGRTFEADFMDLNDAEFVSRTIESILDIENRSCVLNSFRQQRIHQTS